jgi:hypothetical protein
VIGDLHPLVTLIIQAGAVAAALTGIAIFIERVWGPVRRWLANALTNPLIDKLDEMEERWDAHTEYVRYHLGPNGTSTPVHKRLAALEEAVLRREALDTPSHDHE